MAQKWKNRPPGSNWGEFGPDDQLGRLNYLTEENTVRAAQEIRTGKRFCLSLPLNVPATDATNPRRKPPTLKPVIRDGHTAFNLRIDTFDPGSTQVVSDDAVLLYNQHSSQWDSFAHMGGVFDADGDGVDEIVQYNGHKLVNDAGQPRFGDLGAWNLGIEHMARHGVQGRGVLLNMKKHFGEASRPVGYDDVMRLLEADGIEIEQGDIVCCYTGYADKLLEFGADVPPDLPRTHCPAFDGYDQKLLQWIDDCGMAVLVSDNRAVEYEWGRRPEGMDRGPGLPIHEHCLFKLGIHLGEMWYFTEIAEWLEANGRYRFFITAPPLFLPGAVGSPANPIGTV
ncbi:MAG: cyclase family protein [Rhodospirillaceae bacterium]|nr:cyclase family protein [Rhodospirillaceae bacterium]MDD9925836.1 cyclase family protein [Rhodospirillaceae bacterium]